MGRKGGFAVGGFTPGLHEADENTSSSKKLHVIHEVGQPAMYIFAISADKALQGHNNSNSLTHAEMTSYILDDLTVDLNSLAYVVNI